MWLCLGLQIPRILFNSGCSCQGRVPNTGIGCSLQNCVNVGSIPTSLSNFKTFGYATKHDGPNPSTVPNDG